MRGDVDSARSRSGVLATARAVVFLLPVALAACGSARRSEPITGGADLAAHDLGAGERSFMRNCQACHVNGEGGLGPALNDKPLPRFAMRFQVRQGVGAMPAFDEGAIPDRELDDLLDYVQALRKQGP